MPVIRANEGFPGSEKGNDRRSHRAGPDQQALHGQGGRIYEPVVPEPDAGGGYRRSRGVFRISERSEPERDNG